MKKRPDLMGLMLGAFTVMIGIASGPICFPGSGTAFLKPEHWNGSLTVLADGSATTPTQPPVAPSAGANPTASAPAASPEAAKSMNNGPQVQPRPITKPNEPIKSREIIQPRP